MTFIFTGIADELYDMQGTLKLSGQCHNELKAVDVSGLNSGIYFLFFCEKNERTIKNVIKKLSFFIPVPSE